MSKQNQKNTLFNYFTSPPGSNKKPAPSPSAAKTPASKTPQPKTPQPKTPISSAKKAKVDDLTTPVSRNKKVKREDVKPAVEDDVDKENASGDEQGVAPPKKRRRIVVLDSEDSGDEYKPDKKDHVSSESESSGVESDASNDAELDESDDETPKKRVLPPAKKTPGKLTFSPAGFSAKRLPGQKSNSPAGVSGKRTAGKPGGTPTRVSASAKAKLAPLSAKRAGSPPPIGHPDDQPHWTHLGYDFLQPEKIRDAMRRRPDQPGYDPKTLFVPDNFKKECTPAMRQWWEMRSEHHDCVLFFKVGKFYELYHMDAVIGVNELGLSYMKGDKAHSGFPEISYGRFSSGLVRKGYKVARVEQTETPDMMTERCKITGKNSKFDKVMRREICQITTAGTQVYGAMDGEPNGCETNFLLALTERSLDSKTSTFGVCFVDTSMGVFHIGQFNDDRHASGLRNLLAHHPPVQVLFERGTLSAPTSKLLKSSLGTVLKEALSSGGEFWTADKTLKALAEGDYFKESASLRWPKGLKPFLSDGESDSMCLSAGIDSELALSALGACVWYLTQCKLDDQLLAMRLFQTYRPLRQEGELAARTEISCKHLVLDSITLRNLDILYHGTDCKQGTLLHTLDFTKSHFGRRLLRQWLCSPVCQIPAIVARQEAIKDLLDNPHVLADARAKMKTLPDLERLLNKIHHQGNAKRSASHPDSRAIFYDARVYSKRRIQDFQSALTGFKVAQEIAELFNAEKDCLSSPLLLTSMCIAGKSPQGRFPQLSESLEFFEATFDPAEAKKEGRIIPPAGTHAEYDAVLKEIAALKRKQEKYLEEQRKVFQCKVVFVGTGRTRLQLEVAEGVARRATARYELQGQRKGYRRFWTAECRELVAEDIAAEEAKSAVLKELARKIFEQFGAKYEDWSTVIKSLAVLDVLMSLAEYARTEEGETCVPEFTNATDAIKPFVNVTGGRHPCVSAGKDFVSNDTVLGETGGLAEGDTAPTLLLLTGPNMGGKSTLMRQLGLIVLMAHIGCHVPAAACRLTPVDRVFTRVGAEDNIGAGESTFFVEMAETGAILAQATRHSLALVDELGRGTSTHDGSAIATAVARALAVAGCRTVFSTHYHTLVDDFRDSPHVALGHMACMVENEEATERDEDGGGGEETVTFLYKLVSGACPKSYGFNVARLAGMPASVVRCGRRKADALEGQAHHVRLFQDAWRAASAEQLARLFDAKVTIA